MKKRAILSLAAGCVFVASSAFAAANPFADVPTKHWAYDAVSQLAKDGIVDGFDAKTFAGDKTMTRYEMAQVVGKAVYRADKASAEDKKLIDKLSTEFAGELNNLGVRVASLEKNQANLKINGTLEVRYSSKDYEVANKSTDANAQYRLRLTGSAKVDENTAFGFRVVNSNDNYKAGNNFKWNKGTWYASGDGQTTGNTFAIDRAFLTSKLGVVGVTVGSQNIIFGANNFAFDSTNTAFEGVRFAGKSGVVDLAANWGRFESNLDLASIEAGSTIGKVTGSVGYATLKDHKTADAYYDKTIAKYVDFSGKYQFDNRFSLGGEYLMNQATDAAYTDKGKAGFVYALYGAQTLAKKGDQNVKLAYYKANKNGLTQWSSVDNLYNATDAYVGNKAFKGFNVTYNYAFSNAFSGYLFYEKITDNAITADSNGGYKIYRAGLTAKF
ncbi:MAG: S-layer homology domain-containing protein [Pelosinus sp.]|nr:S-layer homology domain-containing protein [Pelosinus sp.]